MSDSKFHDDLEYLYSALLMHPLLLVDEQQRKQFEELYQANSKEQLTYSDFIDAATALTIFFKDGHTNIEVPYTAEDRCIDLQCQWDDKECKQLVLREQYEDLPEGTQIHSINGKTVEEMIQLLSNRIPHENCYLVKSRMIRYPYQNYHVFSEMNLRWLFGEQADYEIVFLVNGKIVKKKCQLTNYDGFLDFADENKFVSYDIQGNAAILHLDSCICNETYKKTLEELVALCDKKQLTSLVLDLSKNMGGSSAVIDEFIKYVNVDSFRRYEMISYASGEAKYITRRQDVVSNQKRKVCFPAEIYCKVSHDTFSSARTFAVTLKDNGIAKIIGTETGGKPNSYGMPKRYRMPNSNIAFRVSISYFLRPDVGADDEISLVPRY